MWGSLFPPLPAHLGKPVHPIRPKNSRLLSRLLGLRWAALWAVVGRRVRAKKGRLMKNKRQHTVSVDDSIHRSPLIPSNSTFHAVWNFCPPNRVYRGMPWRQLATSVSIKGCRKETYTVSGRDTVSRLDHSQIHVYARKKPSKHSLDKLHARSTL